MADHHLSEGSVTGSAEAFLRVGGYSFIWIASGLPIHAGSNAFRKRQREELLDKIHARGTVRAKAHCASDKALTRAPTSVPEHAGTGPHITTSRQKT